MILDSDFFMRREFTSVQAVAGLQILIDRAPSSLLLALTAGILSTPSSSTANGTDLVPTIACRLLALLTKSDRPQMAFDIILHSIIAKPEISSWHRQFLSSALLSRLPPLDARYILFFLAKGIETKLEEQTATQQRENKAQQPYIKVTTVKYLAQLLHQTYYLPRQDSLNILKRLFQASTHIDIQCEIVKSMLAMLAASAAGPVTGMTQHILSGLQAVIPAAGRLTERINGGKPDMTSLEELARLPVIEDEEADQPIFRLLLGSASDSNLPENARQDLVHNIILPAFEFSRATHEEWVQVYLMRHKCSIELAELASVPPRPIGLAAMLNKIPEYLPV